MNVNLSVVLAVICFDVGRFVAGEAQSMIRDEDEDDIKRCSTSRHCPRFSLCIDSYCQCLYGTPVNGTCPCTNDWHCPFGNAHCWQSSTTNSTGACFCDDGYEYNRFYSRCTRQSTTLTTQLSMLETLKACLIVLLPTFIFGLMVFCGVQLSRYLKSQKTSGPMVASHVENGTHYDAQSDDLPPSYFTVVSTRHSFTDVQFLQQ